ncbi:MAG: CopG family transcriptional regulator [Sphingomonas bacterium]
MNVYFDPTLLKQVEALALRRNVPKSAIVEAAVASSCQAIPARNRRPPCRAGSTGSAIMSALNEDLAVPSDTLALFVRFWLTFTPPMTEAAQVAARAQGAERFDGFVQTLGKRLETGDRFLKELSRDADPSAPAATDAEHDV